MKARRLAITLPLLAMLVSTTRCSSHRPDSAQSSTGQNEAVVRRWIDAGFNQRSAAVVDELFAERVVVNGQPVGRDGIRRSMQRHLDGFPDLRVRIDDMVAVGSKVGIWYTAEGRHQGEFESIPPTGKQVKWVGSDLFTFDRGRITEARFLSDLHGLLIQLGAIGSPPPAGERPRPGPPGSRETRPR